MIGGRIGESNILPLKIKACRPINWSAFFKCG